MNKIKNTLNDVVKSMYYGVLIPVFTELQTIIEVGSVNLSWALLFKIFLSSVFAYLVKKAIQKNKVNREELKAVRASASDGDGGSVHPPPLGDPTNPIKK